jgi:hypothetical protein
LFFSSSASYPTFPEFAGAYCPSGRTQQCTVTGVSNFSKYQHEIQSVDTTGAAEIDHIFATMCGLFYNDDIYQ